MKAFVIMVALLVLVGACADDDAVSATLTTIQATTTATQPPTTSTTLRIITGVLVLTPQACESCDGLVTRLQELVGGVVPIEVRVEGIRSVVQVFDQQGSLVKEWRGDESTVNPADRAVADNAEEMIRVACTALGTCSAQVTAATTAPSDLQPNDVACGMEVERRYLFEDERPAPLGVIWDSFLAVPTSRPLIISGILSGHGREEFPGYIRDFAVENGFREDQLWYDFIDLCVGDGDSGRYRVVRLITYVATHSRMLVYSNEPDSSYPIDLLPFGRDVAYNRHAEGLTYVVGRTREVAADYLKTKLVLGRQYVVEVSTANNGLDDVLTWRGEILDYLSGRTGQEPTDFILGFVVLWISPTGSL